MNEFILSLDAGTTTLRAMLVNPDGTVAASRHRRAISRFPSPGRVEQDANDLWETLVGLIRECLAAVGAGPANVAAIGITAQRASIVVWQRGSGRALQPMVVWSDLRGLARAQQLTAEGFLCAPQMASAKLESVMEDFRRETEGAEPAVLWGNVESFLIYRLSGGAAHLTDASHYWPMGYLDLADLQVNQRLIQRQQLNPACFPRLVDTWGRLAETDPAVLGRAIPISAVIADQQASLMAHDGLAPGRCKVTYGTSACLDLATGPTLQLVAAGLIPFVHYRVGGHTGFCLEGMVNTAGTFLDWLIDNLGIGRSHAELLAMAEAVPDSGGVWLLPALQGLGAPHGQGEQRLRIGGMGLDHDRRHLARAALDGICYRVREIWDQLCAAPGLHQPTFIGIDGGLSRSDLLAQLQADSLGVPVHRYAATEATALGAAACAGMGAGLLEPEGLAGFCRYDRVFEPRTQGDQGFDRWREAVYQGRP